MQGLNKIINFLSNISPYTRLLTIVRVIIASSLLLTLIFNKANLLFKPIDGIDKFPSCENINQKIGYFCVMPNSSYFELEVSKWIAIVLLITVIIGYLPQIMGIVHFWIAYSVNVNMTTIDGGEQVAAVLCFWLMFVSLFDNRINHWKTASQVNQTNFVIGWSFIFIIKVQIAYLYLNSAVTKLKNQEWIDGTAVYYYLNDNLLGLPPFLYNIFSFVIETPLVVFITWLTLGIQFILFAAILTNYKNKRIIFWIAVTMHESFAIFLGLITFSMVMFAALILYLIPINKNILKGEKTS